MMDLSIYSRGAVSYETLCDMSPKDVQLFSKRLEKYFEEKSKAMKKDNSMPVK